jgi:sugar lactone lactonase YvrE
MDQVPRGRFRRELLALNDSARQAALDKLGKFKVPVIDLNSLHANEDGSLYYACFPKFEGATVLPPEATNPSQSKVPISSPPACNSRPDATRKLFLDFSGFGYPYDQFKTLPYDLDGDITTFNEYEQAQIVEVWRRVSEDFKPFNVNVTTVKPEDLRTNYDAIQDGGPLIAHVVITKNTKADGKPMPSPFAGGVATLGSFAYAYAYYNNVGGTAANIAEVISHEAGHNFSLGHDGQGKAQYYAGHGNDQQSWGPIMGASYGKNFTQWTTGNNSYSYSTGNWTTINSTYTGGTNAEDDISTIGNQLGYAADDAPNTLNATITANSTKIPTSAGKFSTKEYAIGLRAIDGPAGTFAPDDVDVFPIDVDASTLDVTVSSFKVPSSSTYGSNLGLKVEILSSNGSVMASNNSGRNLVRAVRENLTPGTYYISVSGAGFGNSTATPPLGFPRDASLGTYSISGTISGASTGGNNTITDPASLLASSTALSSLSLSSGVLSPSPTYRYKVSSDGSVPVNQAVSLAFDANPANPAANLISLAVRPTPTPDPSASPTPTTQAPLLSVSSLITRTWGSGMQGQLFVRNSTRNNISNWSLAFHYPSAITSVGALNPSGLITTHAGSGMRSPMDGNPSVAGFYSPQGIALHTDGTMYVADRLNHRIRKITASGNVTTLAGSGNGFANGQGSAASFTQPHGVAVDGNGTVYVADSLNHRIRKITAGGNVTTLAGSGDPDFSDGNGTAASFRWPSGVAVDGNGTVYVADSSNNRIRKITPTGNVTTLAGSGFTGLVDGQGTAASFGYPSGVAVDGTGAVYVADTGNNRIRKITPSGMVTTLAGPVTPGSPDGQILSANFSGPVGVAVDGNGTTVYVADTGNNVISKTTSSGNVTFSREITAREFVATVPNEAASITLNWTTENPVATSRVKLNSANFTSFNGTGNFSLSPGENTIMLEVTSADTTAKGYHRFTITRQASPPVPGTQLASLSFGVGNWDQTFSANITNYDITLANGNSTVSINANKLDAGGKIEARVGNGVFFPLVSGRQSALITLPVGVTTIETRLTSANGTSSSYFFNLNRTATTPALSNLLVRWNATNLSMTPSSFSSNTTTYNATVANSVSAVTLTPTVSERNSSVAVRVGSRDFVNVTSGNPSAPLGLTANATNTVEVRVLSDNNTTNRTYSLNITRLAAPVTSPVGGISSNGTTFNGTIDARSTSAAFQYGTTPALGTALIVSPFSQGAATVSVPTGALLPSTQYFYRLTSQYGSFTDFGETLSFITPASASSANLTQVTLTGASVTGGTFTDFAYPALNIGNHTAFQGFLSYGVAGSKIFGGVWMGSNSTTSLAAGIGASAPDNAVFSGVGEPILDDSGRMTFTGFLRVGIGAVRSNTSAGIWQVAANGTTSKIVRAGDNASGATGTVFSTFNKLVAGNGGISFIATLAAGNSPVNASNNTGLWAQNSAGALVLVARTGANPTPTLRNFTIFNAEPGQIGQSRHFNNSGDLVLTATFGNASTGIYRAIKSGNFTLNATTPVAAIGSAVPGVTGGNFTSLGNPIINSVGDIAFTASFSGNGVASGNNTGIFRYSSNGTGVLVARTGVSYSGGQTFQSLSAPLLNNAKDIAFTGALATGGNVTSSNANGIWTIGSNGTLTKIFRRGDSAPGLPGATFASFSQLAFPANGGIIFAATLATNSLAGVSATNNQGVWAASTAGANPKLIVRTGNSLSVGGAVKTIFSYDFFSASSVTEGVGRTINSDGDIILKLNFTDKSSGLFRYDAP